MRRQIKHITHKCDYLDGLLENEEQDFEPLEPLELLKVTSIQPVILKKKTVLFDFKNMTEFSNKLENDQAQRGRNNIPQVNSTNSGILKPILSKRSSSQFDPLSEQANFLN